MDDPVSIRWSVSSDEVFVVSKEGRVFATPISRQDNRVRLGTTAELFRLDFPSNDQSFGVSADSQRFIFSMEPDAMHQSLFVLGNWPARLE